MRVAIVGQATATCHNRIAVEPPLSEPLASGRHLPLTSAVVVPGVLAANDPASTRLVYAMVIGLALVGVAAIVLGVWLIRRTRVDPPVLGPLERMGGRRWKRRDLVTQQRMLDEVRPPGASPLHRLPDPPKLLAEFDEPRPVTSLSDLGPGLAAADDTADTADPEPDPHPEPETAIEPDEPADAPDGEEDVEEDVAPDGPGTAMSERSEG